MKKSTTGLSREVTAIALTLMEGLSCSRSLTVAILLRHHEYGQLANLSVDPLHYNDSESYWCAAQATAFLKKNVDMPGNDDRTSKTIAKWFENERLCYRTNQRLLPFVFNTFRIEDEPILSFLAKARKVVWDILGSAPPFDWEGEGRFGPGATMSDKSLYTTVPDKMSSVPTLTPNAWPFLFPWMGTRWYEASAKLGNVASYVRGNSFFTVRKTAAIERACGKECSINVFYQLALGKVMKRCLRSWGINLKEGKEIHMQVACAASLSGAFSTLDLSSASDCVASALVKLLLPPQWYEVLEHLRSPATLVEGKWVVLEKFSSMGNGYTFELETILFAAISAACMGDTCRPGKNLFVLGDDIIVPTEKAHEVTKALEYFGFTLNTEKSFTQGNFRESCGGDYYLGVGVRPYYLENDCYEPQHYISLANGIRRSAMAHTNGCRFDWVRASWFRTMDCIPSSIRACRGPEALGDLVIHDVRPNWLTRWRSWIRYVKVYRPATYKRVRWNGFAYDVQFSAALYGVSRMKSLRAGHEGDLIPRDAVTGYKVGWVPYS